MQKEKITCHVYLFCKQGKMDALLDALEVCARESRREPGCEYYEIVQNINNPQQITLIEKYTSYQDFKNHFKTPAIRHFIDNLQHELLESMSNSLHVTRVDCIGSVSDKFSINDLNKLVEMIKDET